MSDWQAGWRTWADRDNVGTGCGLTLVLHVVAVVVLFIIVPPLAVVFFLLLGVTQLVYMVPAILIASVRGRRNTAKGLLIGTAVTFMLSAACWVLVPFPTIH